MSLQILAAHTGERYSTEPGLFAALDAFKTWLSQETSTPTSHQIILTSTGKQAKLQSLGTEVRLPAKTPRRSLIDVVLQDELFLYNRQLVSSSSSPSVSAAPLITKPPHTYLSPAPDTLANQNDIGAWQDLFKARRSWAMESLEKAKLQAREVSRHFDAFDVIERGVGVAVGNLEAHVKSLEQHYSEALSWSDQEIQHQSDLLRSLDAIPLQIKPLPANAQFLRFFPALDVYQPPARRQTQEKGPSLASFIEPQALKEAVSTVRSSVRSFAASTKDLGKSVDEVLANANKLFDTVERSRSESASNMAKDAAQLMEEIEVVANKVDADCEETLGLAPGTKSVAQASKMALQHTRSFLPSLREYSHEIGELLRHVIDQRNAAAAHAIKDMQNVAANEASFARVDHQVKTLDFATDQPEDAFNLVELASQLPFVYGALLIEAVRRREWAEKLRGESASLAEDIAGYREEEERRRKRWLKNIGQFIRGDAVTGRALEFELNLQAEESKWPEMSREDVEQYLNAMKKVQDLTEVLKELDANFKDIDRPTKRQIKTTKNFKGGSLYDANTGKSSFLTRDNEEMKVLRESNLKLEDEVKGQKSRVRKLEDLLYKQSQAGRSASGNIFQSQDPPPVAERTVSGRFSPSLGAPDSLARRESMASRRSSGAKSGEERLLARRIVDMEGQFLAERQRKEELERRVNNRRADHEHVHAELEETKSTKKDLMANLEAQQKEFAGERRSLEEEIRKQKNRAEEAEEELDRMVESHDNENINADGKIRSLESHIDQTKQTVIDLEADVKRREEMQEEQDRTLRTMHRNLSPGAVVPSSTAELVNSLDELVERSARHFQDLELAVTAAKSEREETQTTLDRKEKDVADLRDHVQELEEETTTLRNESSTEEARAASLTEELEDGRQQLRNLRTKFAEGETGSESLRQRVEEQAARASGLATELAESKSHVNSLDVELSTLQRKHHQLVASSNTMSSKLDKRTARARELTSRLVAYHQELARLLESLGLSVTRRDGAMVIQRSSKLANMSTTLTEPNAHNIGSTTLPAGMQPFDTSIDPMLTSWTQLDSSQNESERFGSFVAKIDDFSLTTFSEAVIKLRRDVEWTGKKWKLEARNYRDRLHRSQSEAHDKIAFRAFKEGDLALFLPTRNQATRPWAAFNVGAPHYFLREQDSHKLQNREWLVARISKIEDRVVNLSKTMGDSLKGDRHSIGETSEGGLSFDDDNPFELSDGLRWYLLDAVEEKPGAPTTPGLGKTTVASAHVDAKGSIRMKKQPAGNDASGKLNKSLESRRSSSNSKRGSISSMTGCTRDGTADSSDAARNITSAPAQQRPTSRSSAGTTSGVDIRTHGGGGAASTHEQTPDEVRKDLLWGP